MIPLLLCITVLANAVMDAIMSNDSFAKYGKWFSRDGWQIKHTFCEWLNQFLPLWLSKFLAEDVLVCATELYKFAKMVMILSFLTAIFGFHVQTIVAYMVWGMCFSLVYAFIR
jgi:hypothetical protein